MAFIWNLDSKRADYAPAGGSSSLNPIRYDSPEQKGCSASLDCVQQLEVKKEPSSTHGGHECFSQ